MKAIMVMYDSLNRRMLQPYGCDWTETPNFCRLAAHAVRFDNHYANSLPCMPARREITSSASIPSTSADTPWVLPLHPPKNCTL